MRLFCGDDISQQMALHLLKVSPHVQSLQTDQGDSLKNMNQFTSTCHQQETQCD